jgi:hypothetical protein
MNFELIEFIIPGTTKSLPLSIPLMPISATFWLGALVNIEKMVLLVCPAAS